MAKITLGKCPKTFPKTTLTVALPSGGEGDIGVVFKYRTRSQYGAFVDGIFKTAQVDAPELAVDASLAEGAGAPSESQKAFQFSLAQALAKTTEKNADFILDAVDSWDLPHEFTRASVEQLCDEVPGAALAVIEKYRLTCVEGRLGN